MTTPTAQARLSPYKAKKLACALNATYVPGHTYRRTNHLDRATDSKTVLGKCGSQKFPKVPKRSQKFAVNLDTAEAQVTPEGTPK